METKGVTCKIPLDLHNRISEEIRATESTMSKFIEMIIQEHYEKGAGKVMAKGRTLAFQVSEELFQRVKEYLERFEKVHRRLTQKEFIIGLIEQALEEAEEEFEAAEAAGREEQEESAWDAAQGGATGEGDDPSTGLPSEHAAWSAPQEDGQETADEDEEEAESEAAESEDADEAEEEIYA